MAGMIVVDACAGRAHSVVLLDDGRVLGFGKQYGEEGDREATTPSEIHPKGGWDSRVVGVACGDEFSAAWTAEGLLYTWGRNPEGVLCLSHISTLGQWPKAVSEPTMVPPSQFGGTEEDNGGRNKVVKVAGFRNRMLVITETPGTVYMCGKHFGKGHHTGMFNEDPTSHAIKLPEHLANHRVVSASLGGNAPIDLAAWDHKYLTLVVLEDPQDTRKRLYGMGSLEEIGQEKASWTEFKLLMDNPGTVNGEGGVDVEDVVVGKNHALVLMSDKSLRILRNTNVPFVEKFMNSRETISFFDGDTVKLDEKTQVVESLQGKVESLPKSCVFGNRAIVLTTEGRLVGTGSNIRGALGVGRTEGNVVSKLTQLRSPALSPGRWCKLPKLNPDAAVWNWPFRLPASSSSSSLPLTALRIEKAEEFIDKVGDRPFRVYPKEWAEEGDTVKFECEGGLLAPSSVRSQGGAVCRKRTRTHAEGRETMLEGEEEGEFDIPLDKVECKGCTLPTSWNNPFLKAPFLHLAVEVNRLGESEDKWSAEVGRFAVAVGDRVRTVCRSGILVARSGDDEERDRAAAGVECQWWSDAQGREKQYAAFNLSTTVLCRIPVGPYPVYTDSVFRAPSREWFDERDEWKEWDPDNPKGIGINDTLSFECKEKGVLWVASGRQAFVGAPTGATCADPHLNGTDEYSLRVADVRCGGSALPFGSEDSYPSKIKTT
uniref:Uncharacterized protein n=1 Tax=Chromera velia CCMP2878 TaxID=1169474 RepID=A0A0G4FIZ5_9ALVE|eukprot:Cvel_17290.t1-p1 / transcript=Cvel_17290.t1 / gene=Cvel_17290 / organism=Chromera_velia_CCMP2878 / gene_product=hypothetical protein / transcript_product=hypothetical protein / location=Cvel_scaffold1372:13204-17708(-) / protein_length=711 / sequence_SO=supercontig / SO=protein_coding / is_pseudo=false